MVVIIVCCSGLIMDVNPDQTATTHENSDGLAVIMLLRDEEWIGLSEDQELEVLQVIANQTDYTAE